MKKGVFSTISGFFLIVVLVFGLIIFLGIYTNIISISGFIRDDLSSFETSKQFKESLMTCHGYTFLRENLLVEDAGRDSDFICPFPSDVKGYVVSQSDFFGCSSKQWGVGDFDYSAAQRIVYNVLVVDSASGKNCLGTLTVVI